MLRKIRATLVGNSARAPSRSEVALGALEQLIRLADRAQIPLIGGGFGVVIELIQTFQASCEEMVQFPRLLSPG